VSTHPEQPRLVNKTKRRKKMSSTTLYRLSGISLLLGAVVSVIAGSMTLFFDSSLRASPSTIQSPLWSTYWSLAFVTILTQQQNVAGAEVPSSVQAVLR
jgi:Na+-transporting NADH:ubiquinone oxidoreductase subunit NqrE